MSTFTIQHTPSTKETDEANSAIYGEIESICKAQTLILRTLHTKILNLTQSHEKLSTRDEVGKELIAILKGIPENDSVFHKPSQYKTQNSNSVRWLYHHFLLQYLIAGSFTICLKSFVNSKDFVLGPAVNEIFTQLRSEAGGLRYLEQELEGPKVNNLTVARTEWAEASIWKVHEESPMAKEPNNIPFYPADDNIIIELMHPKNLQKLIDAARDFFPQNPFYRNQFPFPKSVREIYEQAEKSEVKPLFEKGITAFKSISKTLKPILEELDKAIEDVRSDHNVIIKAAKHVVSARSTAAAREAARAKSATTVKAIEAAKAAVEAARAEHRKKMDEKVGAIDKLAAKAAAKVDTVEMIRFLAGLALCLLQFGDKAQRPGEAQQPDESTVSKELSEEGKGSLRKEQYWFKLGEKYHYVHWSHVRALVLDIASNLLSEKEMRKTVHIKNHFHILWSLYGIVGSLSLVSQDWHNSRSTRQEGLARHVWRTTGGQMGQRLLPWYATLMAPDEEMKQKHNVRAKTRAFPIQTLVENPEENKLVYGVMGRIFEHIAERERYGLVEKSGNPNQPSLNHQNLLVGVAHHKALLANCEFLRDLLESRDSLPSSINSVKTVILDFLELGGTMTIQNNGDWGPNGEAWLRNSDAARPAYEQAGKGKERLDEPHLPSAAAGFTGSGEAEFDPNLTDNPIHEDELYEMPLQSSAASSSGLPRKRTNRHSGGSSEEDGGQDRKKQA